MPKVIIKNFTFHRGRTFSQDFEIINFNDEIDEILFTSCESSDNKHYCLRKSLGNGITLVDSGNDENGNNYKTYNLTIEATDTDHMKPSFDYGYDVVMFSKTKKYQLLEGTLKLARTQTKTCNEC